MVQAEARLEAQAQAQAQASKRWPRNVWARLPQPNRARAHRPRMVLMAPAVAAAPMLKPAARVPTRSTIRWSYSELVMSVTRQTLRMSGCSPCGCESSMRSKTASRRHSLDCP